MTLRATILGFLLGLTIAAVGYLNDWGMKLPGVACNLVPASVFGFLVVGMLVLNPLLRFLRFRQLSAGEWCAMLSLMLVACVIPGPGLMWQFTEILVMPHHNYDQNYKLWDAYKLLDYTPPIMLVDASADREKVVEGFLTGVGKTDYPPIASVPWGAFFNTLSFWVPFLALGMVATVCLMLVLHGQWSQRERLRYPVAEFATELLEGTGENAFSSILRDRRFWFGFAVAFGILTINGLRGHWQQSIYIPLQFDFSAVTNKWPYLRKIHWQGTMFRPRLFFVAIGFAYFVSSDVSFSVGISHAVFAVVYLAAVNADLKVSGHYIGGGMWDYQVFGSYLGMTIIMLYIGRRFYGSVVCSMFGLRRGEKIPGSVTLAAWGGVLSAASIVFILCSLLGLHWLQAILFVLFTGMLYLVLTRINVETGLIIIQPRWHVVEILVALFSFNALGPNMFIILALLSVATAVDPRSCLMPMIANSLRFSEPRRLRLGRLSGWMAFAVVAALVLGMVSTIYFQYGLGKAGQFWWAPSVGNFSHTMLYRHLVGGKLIRETGATWYDFSWSDVRPEKDFLWAAGFGLVVVLVCSFLRLRFPWWPIHPLLFLIWGVDTVTPLCFSFLLGWLIKVCVTHFGGGGAFRKCKPFFVGLVAGELGSAVAWTVVGLTYHLSTGMYWEGLPILTGDIPRVL
ncbi:MAG: DUF6785 family protein [Planctomycetota bacterium]|jgi:hypothetical protein